MGSSGKWEREIEPTRAHVQALVSQVRVWSGSFVPSHDSLAMAELGREFDFAAAWGAQKAANAHSTIAVAMVAALDHLQAICSLYSLQPAFVAAPSVLARASLESLSIASWLSDPSIDLRERIARHQTLRLFELSEADPSEHLERRRQAIAESATALGYRVKVNKHGVPVYIDNPLPQSGAMIEDMLGPAADGIGLDEYRRLSRLAHGRTPLVLSLSVPVESSPPTLPGAVARAFASSAADVVRLLGIQLWAFVRTVGRWFVLNRWGGDDWPRASQNAVRQVHQALDRHEV